jgi:hypothetical protein
VSGTTPADARQRWRITFARRPDAPELPPKDQLAAWEASLVVSGLPLAGVESNPERPRLVFGAPLPAGVPAEADLVDCFLLERRPIAEVRARLAGSLPAGHALVGLHDVWLGEPSLAGSVIAADYRVELASGAPDRTSLAAAAVSLLAAPQVLRTRAKGERAVEYDLRPLVAGVEVGESDAARPPTLRIRTRFHAERGVGRPEEVVGALGDLAGAVLLIAAMTRERLWLAEDAGPAELG